MAAYRLARREPFMQIDFEEKQGAGNGITVNSTRARRRKLRIQARACLVEYRASPRLYQVGIAAF
jgi:hypothetical protein